VVELTEDAYLFMLFLAIKADTYKRRKKIDKTLPKDNILVNSIYLPKRETCCGKIFHYLSIFSPFPLREDPYQVVRLMYPMLVF